MYDEQRNTVWRFAIIFIAIFIGFAAVLGRIIYIQAFEREAWLKVAEQQVPTHRPIAATRGNILDCNDEYLINLMRTVKRISNHLVDDCGYEGVNLLNASDESAGQSVFHFHIHVIPRKAGDNIKAWPNFGGAETATEDIFKKIKML